MLRKIGITKPCDMTNDTTAVAARIALGSELHGQIMPLTAAPPGGNKKASVSEQIARGYSALGDYKRALPYMKATLPQAPDDLNKNSVVEMIRKLQAKQDVNVN